MALRKQKSSLEIQTAKLSETHKNKNVAKITRDKKKSFSTIINYEIT